MANQETNLSPQMRERARAFMEQRRSERANQMKAESETVEPSPAVSSEQEAPEEESDSPEIPANEPESEVQESEEEPRIPYFRFKQVLDENKSLKGSKTDVGRMKKELAAYRKKEEKYKQVELAAEFSSRDNLPEEFELWDEPRQQGHMAALAATHRDSELEDLKTQVNQLTMQQNMSRHFGSELDNDQFQSIVSVGEEVDWALTPDECAAIALQRNPSLFAAEGSNSELPPSQKVPDRAGSRRAKPVAAQRSKKVAMDQLLAADSTAGRIKAAGDYLKVARSGGA